MQEVTMNDNGTTEDAESKTSMRDSFSPPKGSPIRSILVGVFKNAYEEILAPAVAEFSCTMEEDGKMTWKCNLRNHKTYGQAIYWFLFKGTEYVFDFEAICDILDFNPEKVRERVDYTAKKRSWVIEMVGEQLSEICKGEKIYSFVGDQEEIAEKMRDNPGKSKNRKFFVKKRITIKHLLHQLFEKEYGSNIFHPIQGDGDSSVGVKDVVSSSEEIFAS